MDELEIKGKKYISSKRASEISGYAKDYIGQLARGGKIDATRFGRAWYVSESALLAHMGGAALEEVQAVQEIQPIAVNKVNTSPAKKPILSPALYSPYNFPKTWSQVTYYEDNSEILPSLIKKSTETSDEITNKTIVSSDTVDKKNDERSVILKKRIESLEKGIEIKKPIIRLPQVKAIDGVRIQSVPVAVETKERPAPRYVRSLVPVLIAGSLLLFVLGASGLFFGSQTLYSTSNAEYTASVLPSFEYVIGIFMTSPLIQGGLEALTGLYQAVSGSFWQFFETGLDFVKNI